MAERIMCFNTSNKALCCCNCSNRARTEHRGSYIYQCIRWVDDHFVVIRIDDSGHGFCKYHSLEDEDEE